MVILAASPKHTASGRRLAWKVVTLLDNDEIESLLGQPELPVAVARCARRELGRRADTGPVALVAPVASELVAS